MILIKLQYLQEIHIYSGPKNFENLQNYIKKAFQSLPNSYKLQYQDPEEEYISVSCSQDLDALQILLKHPKLFIIEQIEFKSAQSRPSSNITGKSLEKSFISQKSMFSVDSEIKQKPEEQFYEFEEADVNELEGIEEHKQSIVKYQSEYKKLIQEIEDDEEQEEEEKKEQSQKYEINNNKFLIQDSNMYYSNQRIQSSDYGVNSSVNLLGNKKQNHADEFKPLNSNLKMSQNQSEINPFKDKLIMNKNIGNSFFQQKSVGAYFPMKKQQQ